MENREQIRNFRPTPAISYRVTRRKTLEILAALVTFTVLPPVRWIRGRLDTTPRKEARFYRPVRSVVAPFILPLLLGIASCKAGAVHEPVVAGRFYPSDGAKLKTDVNGYISSAGEKHTDGAIFGLIAPHAGFTYSGPVAGYAYREVKGAKYDLVVIIAPSHTTPINGVSVLDKDIYRTPLGDIPIDRKTVQDLIRQADWIRYVPAVFAGEHSMEVHLPFIQESLQPGYKILPIVVGNPSPALAAVIADTLSRTLHGRKVLYVASSDMSHYHSYDEASDMDNRTLGFIERGETQALVERCSARDLELCGLGPVQVVMELSRRMGIRGGTVLKYANSGDTAGSKSQVVGYGSIAFVNPQEDLSISDKQTLLALARSTLEEYVKNVRRPDAPHLSSALREPGAVFVTLKKGNRLRGCIGQIRATMPLYRSVIEMTVSACSRDRRFQTVSPEESASIRLQISVLSPFIKVDDVEKINVGLDGLYLAAQGRTGVLLPQVPTEQGWNRDRFLKEICLKAGLPEGSWNDEGAELYTFTAQVFSE